MLVYQRVYLVKPLHPGFPRSDMVKSSKDGRLGGIQRGWKIFILILGWSSPPRHQPKICLSSVICICIYTIIIIYIYIILYHIILYYIILYYTILYYILLYYIILYYIYRIKWYYTILYCGILYYIMLYYVKRCHNLILYLSNIIFIFIDIVIFILYYIISYYIILYHIISYYIILYCIMVFLCIHGRFYVVLWHCYHIESIWKPCFLTERSAASQEGIAGRAISELFQVQALLVTMGLSLGHGVIGWKKIPSGNLR